MFTFFTVVHHYAPRNPFYIFSSSSSLLCVYVVHVHAKALRLVDKQNIWWNNVVIHPKSFFIPLHEYSLYRKKPRSYFQTTHSAFTLCSSSPLFQVSCDQCAIHLLCSLNRKLKYIIISQLAGENLVLCVYRSISKYVYAYTKLRKL